MNKKYLLFLGVALIGLFLAEFQLKVLSIWVILLLAVFSRLMLRQIPFFEMNTCLVVFTGMVFGPWVGAYSGFFTILLADATLFEFNDTIWNAPIFALLGYLAAVLPLEFVFLVAVLTIVYNILISIVLMVVHGAHPFISLAWGAVHTFVNVSVATYIGAHLASLLLF